MLIWLIVVLLSRGRIGSGGEFPYGRDRFSDLLSTAGRLRASVRYLRI